MKIQGGSFKIDIIDPKTQNVIRAGKWHHNTLTQAGLDFTYDRQLGNTTELYGAIGVSNGTGDIQPNDTDLGGSPVWKQITAPALNENNVRIFYVDFLSAEANMVITQIGIRGNDATAPTFIAGDLYPPTPKTTGIQIRVHYVIDLRPVEGS